MKKEPTPSRPKKDPLHSRHSAYAPPTVIHNPEEDEAILARWVRRGMERGPGFWIWVLAGVALALLIVTLGSRLLFSGRTTASESWEQLMLGMVQRTDQAKVTEEYPDTVAAQWANLREAQEALARGIEKLPTSRDSAGAQLGKALELFTRVAEDADPKSPLARLAAFGRARTLETRNRLKQAITEYRKVAETWPETLEGRQAKQLAAVLQEPDSQEFYTKLYAYKPPEVTLPPGGKATIPDVPAPKDLAPPPSPAPVGSPEKVEELPDDLFGPPATKKDAAETKPSAEKK